MYGHFTEWVESACWWSCIGQGYAHSLRSRLVYKGVELGQGGASKNRATPYRLTRFGVARLLNMKVEIIFDGD